MDSTSPPSPNPSPRPGFLVMVIALAATLIKDRTSRRLLMFRLTAGILLMVFTGSFPLEKWLLKHPAVFAFWWIGTFLGVVFLFLLAIYDLGRVRAAHQFHVQAMRLQLESEMEALRQTLEKEGKTEPETGAGAGSSEGNPPPASPENRGD